MKHERSPRRIQTITTEQTEPDAAPVRARSRMAHTPDESNGRRSSTVLTLPSTDLVSVKSSWSNIMKSKTSRQSRASTKPRSLQLSRTDLIDVRGGDSPVLPHADGIPSPSSAWYQDKVPGAVLPPDGGTPSPNSDWPNPQCTKSGMLRDRRPCPSRGRTPSRSQGTDRSFAIDVARARDEASCSAKPPVTPVCSHAASARRRPHARSQPRCLRARVAGGRCSTWPSLAGSRSPARATSDTPP